MKFGLPTATIEKIRAVLARFPQIDRAVLYGSRAKGNFKPGSDIDLTLFGEPLTSTQLGQIAGALDDLLLPYTIDLSIYADLNHAKLREHIDRVGVVFYERGSAGEDPGAAVKKGWEIKTIGETCEVVNGGTPKTGVPEYWDGQNRWITPAEMGKRLSPYVSETERMISDLGLRNSSAQMLPSHSVILSSRAPIGHLVINTEPMATNQGCKGLTPRSQLQHKFLYYYLSSIIDLLNSLGTGATFKELSGGKLKEVPVPVPPLAEQQRIVGLLDEAFEGLATAKANAEKNLQNAHALFESHLQSVFTQKGEGWVEKTLGELCSIARGGSPRPIQKFLTTATDGFNWVKISDATASGKYIYTTEQKIIREGATRSRIVHAGDFLLSNSMSFGRPYIMQTTGCVHDGWLVLSDYASHLDQDYLYLVLGSQFMFQQFDRLAAGSTVRNLNIELASRVEVPVPPLKQQREIAQHLDALSKETQRLAAIYSRKLAALEALKKSLLHQAFSGGL